MLNWAMISSCPVLYSPAGSVPGRMLVALVSMLVRWLEKPERMRLKRVLARLVKSHSSLRAMPMGLLTCTARCGAA